MHASLSVHLAFGLPRCLSPCLANHASFILSVSPSIGVCMCVSMGEMTTGFPAALTTCSTPFSSPPVLPFHPTWPLYLDHPCCPVGPGSLCCAEWQHYSDIFFILGVSVALYGGSWQVKVVLHEKRSKQM